MDVRTIIRLVSFRRWVSIQTGHLIVNKKERNVVIMTQAQTANQPAGCTCVILLV